MIERVLFSRRRTKQKRKLARLLLALDSAAREARPGHPPPVPRASAAPVKLT
jgi:hypothetical protein